MPQIICDTSPLNYLILIGTEDLLPRLFSPVLVPSAVAHELANSKAPSLVRDWIANPPSWLSIPPVPSYSPTHLVKLHPGEREVIALGIVNLGSFLLIDERDGSAEALRRGLNVIGTLGLLDRAAVLGWIDLPEVFRRLQTTSFRAPRRIMERLLEENARRTK